MAIDPICGMKVDEASALHVERDGQTLYFCSGNCRQRYLSKRPACGNNTELHDIMKHFWIGATPRLVMIASIVVIIAGMRAASSVVVIFLLAAFFAAICTIPLAWLQRRGVPNKLAVGLITGGILAFGSLLAVLLALFCGFFLHIGAHGLLPESHRTHPRPSTTVATLLGAAFLYAVTAVVR